MYEQTNEERARRALHAADVALAAGRRAVAVSQTLLSALLDPVVRDLDWAADELSAVARIPVETRPMPAAWRPEGWDEGAERAFAEAMEAERSDPPAPEPLPGPQGVAKQQEAEAEAPAGAQEPPAEAPKPGKAAKEPRKPKAAPSAPPEDAEEGKPAPGARHGLTGNGGAGVKIRRYVVTPKNGGDPFEGRAGECIKRMGVPSSTFYALTNGRQSDEWEVTKL